MGARRPSGINIGFLCPTSQSSTGSPTLPSVEAGLVVVSSSPTANQARNPRHAHEVTRMSYDKDLKSPHKEPCKGPSEGS